LQKLTRNTSYIKFKDEEGFIIERGAIGGVALNEFTIDNINEMVELGYVHVIEYDTTDS